MQWHIHQGDVRQCHATRIDAAQYHQRTCLWRTNRIRRHDGCIKVHDGGQIHVRALPSDSGPRSPAMQQHSRFTAQYIDKLHQLKPMMTPEAISYLRETLPQQELADLEQLLEDIAATASWDYDVQAAEILQPQQEQDLDVHTPVQQSAVPPSDFYSYLQQVVFPGLDNAQLEEVIEIMGRETLSSIAEWYEELVAFQKQEPDPQLLQAKYEELSAKMAGIMQQLEEESSSLDISSNNHNHLYHSNTIEHRHDSRPAETSDNSMIRHKHSKHSRTARQSYHSVSRGSASRQSAQQSWQQEGVAQEASHARHANNNASHVKAVVQHEEQAAITSDSGNEQAIGPAQHHSDAQGAHLLDHNQSSSGSVSQSSITSQLLLQGAARGRETARGAGRTQFEWLIRQPASVAAEWTWDMPSSTDRVNTVESKSSTVGGARAAVANRAAASSQGATLLATQKNRRRTRAGKTSSSTQARSDSAASVGCE